MTVAVIDQQTTLVQQDVQREFVQQTSKEIVTTQSEHQFVITHYGEQTVLVERTSDSVILAGHPGPQGPPGINEEDMVYSKRIDFIDDNTLYRAEATVGSSENSAVWRIRKISLAPDGDVAELWAGGTADFDKQWALRASYSYL